jgi:ribosomal protein S9
MALEDPSETMETMGRRKASSGSEAHLHISKDTRANVTCRKTHCDDVFCDISHIQIKSPFLYRAPDQRRLANSPYFWRAK